MALRDWFQYSDRNKPLYKPTSSTTITIERFWQNEEGEFDSSDWRKEEWLIHCALVPIAQLNATAIEIASPHYLTFETGWNFEDEFGFGDYSEYGDIQLYSLISSIKHPISQELIVEFSREFVLYHALHKRNQSHYYHPVDNILVGETSIDSHEIYDPTPNVHIHRDYLRDFLAAMKMGLLISVVADKLKEQIMLRHYSPKTLKAYAGWMWKLCRFLGNKLPETVTSSDVQRFLADLAVRQQVFASAQNQAFNALLFLFRNVFKRDLGDLHVSCAYGYTKGQKETLDSHSAFSVGGSIAHR